MMCISDYLCGHRSSVGCPRLDKTDVFFEKHMGARAVTHFIILKMSSRDMPVFKKQRVMPQQVTFEGQYMGIVEDSNRQAVAFPEDDNLPAIILRPLDKARGESGPEYPPWSVRVFRYPFEAEMCQMRLFWEGTSREEFVFENIQQRFRNEWRHHSFRLQSRYRTYDKLRALWDSIRNNNRMRYLPDELWDIVTSYLELPALR